MQAMKHRPGTAPSLLVACLLVMGVCVSAAAFPPSETGSAARTVRNFDRVELTLRGELFLTQGGSESLTIEASASDLALITTVVRGTTLQIGQVSPGPAPAGPSPTGSP